MFLACGVGAFGAAMFHLMTHAFFKALMFLGSGSVIHAMHEEQDIRKMGGLRKYMPITHGTFVLGWLAIIGLPPFAGFFSKDEILWQAYHSPLGSSWLWAAGVFGAACTAFYMTRLMALTFWGSSRVAKDVHPHESPISMTIPLLVLGLLSVVGGWIGIPHVLSGSLGLHIPNFLEHWLHVSVQAVDVGHEAPAAVELGLMGMSVAVAGISATIAYLFYVVNPQAPKKFAEAFQPAYELIFNKYWVDEFYFDRLINPLVAASKNLWAYVDVAFVDKFTFWAADIVKGLGSFVRGLQNGNMQTYAMYIALGVAGTLFFIMR